VESLISIQLTARYRPLRIRSAPGSIGKKRARLEGLENRLVVHVLSTAEEREGKERQQGGASG
jgi:hypothetical protein